MAALVVAETGGPRIGSMAPSPICFFSESGSVPNPNGLIQGRRDDQVFGGMEGRTHHIVVVTRQDAQTGTFVEIPQSQGLIVTGGQNPRKLRRIGVELDRANVIEMPQQREKASSQLVIPDLDFVIVTSANDQRFGFVKINSSNRSVVLFESIDDGTNSVIPKLDDTVVQGGTHPRTIWVKGQSLHASRFRLELSKHILLFLFPQSLFLYNCSLLSCLNRFSNVGVCCDQSDNRTSVRFLLQ
mmetsp:Transcript_7624/g.18433  ORF Transcript_7624/g.18433 Transcript_7624/m.18433 type:complete len:242 (+) Transcript_7624:3479-4204(+)